MQIEKHKSGGRSFRSPNSFVLFDLQIFSGGVYPPSATWRTIYFSTCISNSFWCKMTLIHILLEYYVDDTSLLLSSQCSSPPSEIVLDPIGELSTRWGLCALRHGIQFSMEAILACHSVKSTEWLDCHPKSCELWRIRTGPSQRTLLWLSQLKVSRPRPIFRQILYFPEDRPRPWKFSLRKPQKCPLNLVVQLSLKKVWNKKKP